jgi:glutamate N-acetyltransferase/amino-acid N-acetyltransferase
MTPGPGIARTPLPKGFSASGVNSGVRKYRPDLGLIYSDRDAVAAAVYTLNECQAAPIQYCKAILPSSRVRALVTNSGQANAATGPEGLVANQKMVDAIAQSLECESAQVLAASTGVIGFPIQTDKITAAVPELVERLGESAEGFALAILTTDLVPKTVTTQVALSKGEVRITGISKGSGMIHPNMATMLGYLLSDVALTEAQAQELVKEVSDLSFNMISVDGDSSTNDCTFLMANGASGVDVSSPTDWAAFKSALTQVAQILAQAIARDGEGATKLIQVELAGLPDLTLARKAARGVTVSPLIKSAIHGEDPNWGRVLARLGAEGVPAECLSRMTLEFSGLKVFENGKPVAVDLDRARELLKRDTVVIRAEFGSGQASATAWGCDLSKKYVEINGAYMT